jgi:non-heme chloroperoxidase
MAPVVKSVQLPNWVRLPYVDVSGVPVLLVHAIADSWHAFEPLLAHLPASIHAFALTQRGHGHTSRPEAVITHVIFAADLAAFMDALRLEAAVVAGGSSGGFIARRFAMDDPIGPWASCSSARPSRCETSRACRRCGTQPLPS